MKKILSIGLILFGTVIQCAGQAPFFQQYFLQRKNEAVQLNSILQDRKGFMWFGTPKGLYRFDGKNHRRFTSKEGLANDVVTMLLQRLRKILQEEFGSDLRMGNLDSWKTTDFNYLLRLKAMPQKPFPISFLIRWEISGLRH